MAKRIHIHGVRRQETDADLLAYVYYLEGKRLRKRRLERETLEKAKRRKRDEHKRRAR